MPFAGPMGKMTCDKVPPSQLMGPAAVIDVRSVLDDAPNGKSPVITPKMVQDWEGKNGALKASEVVLFYSGYSDNYYKPFPEGNRLAFDLSSSAPSPAGRHPARKRSNTSTRRGSGTSGLTVQALAMSKGDR